MNNKLQGKDLINIGIFTAIYFIVIFAAASIGFIPIFIPLISVIVPLVGGIPMMLFFSKIKKFGMLTICGVLLGIIMLLTGMGYWCIDVYKRQVLHGGEVCSERNDLSQSIRHNLRPSLMNLLRAFKTGKTMTRLSSARKCFCLQMCSKATSRWGNAGPLNPH